MSGANRRKHFRVDDEAYVVAKIVPVDRIKDVARDISRQAKTKTKDLTLINKKIQDGLAIMRGQNIRLAGLLEALDDKMEHILKSIHQASGDAAYILQPINLSEGGCRFYVPGVLEVGTIIDINIRFNEMESMRSLAKIVMCKEAETTHYGTHIVACEFKAMLEASRELILTRVFDKQQEMLRERAAERLG